MVNILRYYNEMRTWSAIASADLPQPLSAANIPSGTIIQATGGNPSGTSSLTFVMMGLGSSFVIQPTLYTRVHATVTGQLANSAASDIAIVRLRFGTGAAPANGVAETGTGFGVNLQAVLNNANTAGLAVPCTLVGIMTGLTPSTTYWIDVSMESITGGSSSIINTNLVAFEFP